MLKIITRTDGPETIFELEGKLVGPWVGELEACWRERMFPDRVTNVVLKSVTFIDARGKELLAQMYRQGARLVAEGCMNKAIINEITGGEGQWTRLSKK